MVRVSADDLRVFSECVEQLYRCDDIEAFPRHVVGIVPRLLPGTFHAYTEVNPVRNRAVGIVEPPTVDTGEISPVLMKYSRQHPVIDYYQRTGDGRAAKISDFITPAQWHSTDIYQQFYRDLGVEDQMSITLPAPLPIAVALVVSRDRRDFTERDRTIYNLFRPHMVAAYELADRVSRLRHDAQTTGAALESMDVGLVRVTPARRVEFASAKARLWMERHLPEPKGGPTCLPDLIDNWLTRIAPDNLSEVAATPLRLESADDVLEVRCKRMEGGDALLLMECHPRARGVGALRAMGLTPREAEVLYWVREGKTNAEVGIILGTSGRTVQKQLENIFRKLGVRTRTAAATHAHEAERRGV